MTERGARRAYVVPTGLAAAVAVLMTTACTSQTPQPPATATPTQSSSPTASATVGVIPVPVPPGGSVAGLPGWLYYMDYPNVYRLTPAGAELVLAEAWNATVSPDGLWIAYVDDESGELIVADRAGGQARSLMSGVIGVGYEPAWSPDSTRLLVGRSPDADGIVTLGVVEVASGAFTELPHQPEAIHPLWSADGQHLGFATGTCQIGIADVDGGNARQVPVFGSLDVSVNPERRRSCDPYSISPDGGLMAVNQRTGDEPDGDVGRDLWADAVVDTQTGADVALPVPGRLAAVLFLPNGEVLVRSTDGDTFTLTLLSPDWTVKAQVAEPAAIASSACGTSVWGCSLLAYTPN